MNVQGSELHQGATLLVNSLVLPVAPATRFDPLRVAYVSLSFGSSSGTGLIRRTLVIPVDLHFPADGIFLMARDHKS